LQLLSTVSALAAAGQAQQNAPSSNGSLSQSINYYLTKLKLESLLKLHHIHATKINGEELSINDWCLCMNNLQAGILQLQALRNDIARYGEQFKLIMNGEKEQFKQLETQNAANTDTHSKLQATANELQQRLRETQSEIERLTRQKQQMEQQSACIANNLQTLREGMENYALLKQRYVSSITERVQNVTQIQSLSPVIATVHDRYADSVQTLRTSLSAFEREWKHWNPYHVLTWFKNIDDGHFNRDDQYQAYQKHIVGDDINGTKLSSVDDLSLSMFGVTQQSDRQRILQNIKRLLTSTSENDRKNNEEDKNHQTENTQNNNEKEEDDTNVDNRFNALLQAIQQMSDSQ